MGKNVKSAKRNARENKAMAASGRSLASDAKMREAINRSLDREGQPQARIDRLTERLEALGPAPVESHGEN